MGREVKLERVRYLDGLARFYEWVTAALVVGILTGGLLLEGVDGVVVALAGLLLAAISGYRAYRFRVYIESLWGELMREDPQWVARSPLTLVAMAAIAAAIVILATLARLAG